MYFRMKMTPYLFLHGHTNSSIWATYWLLLPAQWISTFTTTNTVDLVPLQLAILYLPKIITMKIDRPWDWDDWLGLISPYLVMRLEMGPVPGLWDLGLGLTNQRRKEFSKKLEFQMKFENFLQNSHFWSSKVYTPTVFL